MNAVVSLPRCYAMPWLHAWTGGDVPPDTIRLRTAMRQHLGLVWRVLRRLGLSEQDTDECAQDVFFVLARRLADVVPRAEKSFLISTAFRAAADRRRHLACHPQAELPAELPSHDLPLDELVTLRRARALLDEALDTLTPEQRAVFVLVEMEELTGPEAAAALGIPLGTVSSRLRQARRVFDSTIRRMRLRELRRRA